MKQPEIERLLPAVFRRTASPGSPLSALLAVMEQHHEPVEARLDQLHQYFDPLCAPDPFVLMLATWLDLDWLLGDPPETNAIDPGRLRLVVDSAVEIARWRGTSRGLRALLALATGSEPYEIDEHPVDDAGRARPFHLIVRAPEAARPVEALIRRIVESEKPAFTTAELHFVGQMEA